MNVGIEKVVYNIIYIYIIYNCIFPIGTKKLIVSC